MWIGQKKEDRRQKSVDPLRRKMSVWWWEGGEEKQGPASDRSQSDVPVKFK